MVDEKAFQEALAKLGEPDDVFNKYHMDEGELRAFVFAAQQEQAKPGEPLTDGEREPVCEIKPCPYVNGFAADNTGVGFVLNRYDAYSDLVLFEDGKPARCFRFSRAALSAADPQARKEAQPAPECIYDKVKKLRDASTYSGEYVAYDTCLALLREAGAKIS